MSGRLGANLSVDQGREAARLAALNALVSPEEINHQEEPTMTQIKKVLYTAKTHTTGGRKRGCLEALMAAWTLSFRLQPPAHLRAIKVQQMEPAAT
jgi:hypothetical protein